ncbi:Uncharacterized protein PBTT_10404 [Plasmodiophora brassicae]
MPAASPLSAPSRPFGTSSRVSCAFLTTQTVPFVAFAGVAGLTARLLHARRAQFQQESKQNLQSVFQKVDGVVRAVPSAVGGDDDADDAAPPLFRGSQVETFHDLAVHEDAVLTMRQLLVATLC